MTGVEMAGIALAVAPLCIYILEHHEAELRPFKALWGYRKQYRRSAEDLGLCLVQLEDVVSGIFRDAGISTDGRDINALVQAYDPSVWKIHDQEARLIAHFGKTQYKHGFEVKLRRIRDGILEVSKALGLENLGTSGGDDEVWSRIQKAKDQQDAPCDPKSTSQTRHFLKSRAKLVLGSISIGKIVEDLDESIQWLARAAEAAEKRTSAATKEWGPTANRQRAPTFKPSLQDIGVYAQRLHDALRDVWTCSQHDCHHVNLRLDQRLKSRDTSCSSMSQGMMSFTLKFAASTDAHTWNTVEICVPESISTAPEPISTIKKARFSDQPGQVSAGSIILQERGIRDLCTPLSQHQTVLSRVYLNPSNEIVRRTESIQKAKVGVQPMRRMSFKTLLHEPRDPAFLGALLTTEQSISLGSTIVSTALQLSSTAWLTTTWSAEDLFFIRPNSAIDTDETYVTVAYGSVTTGQSSDQQLPRSDGTFFVRLGVILLEIWAQMTIEDLRLKDLTLVDPNTSNGPWRDVATIKEYLQRYRGSMQPCFLKAIGFCMTAFATGIADTSDANTCGRMAKEALHPFERELQYWRSETEVL